MAIEWVKSATKHYPIADGINAVQNRVFLLPRYDVDPETGEDVDLVIGPARDGRMLEILIHRREPRTIFVFHVLHFRPATKQRARVIIEERQKKEGME